MGNIKIIKGVFDTKLELGHAGVKHARLFHYSSQRNTYMDPS